MLFLGVFVVLLCLDQWIKIKLEKLWKLNKILPPSNRWISFYHVRNYGLAYGLGKQSPKVVLVIHTGGIIFLCGMILYFKKALQFDSIGFSLLLAGGISNLIDRYKDGAVLDFFSFSKWKKSPVFNFADVCVLIGTVVVLLSMIKEEFM